jgi:SAM-dependent methyltransferase
MFSRRSLLLAATVPVLRGQNRKPNMFGDAEKYERFMGRWSRLMAPLLVDFTGLPDRGRVLDVGSGTGSLAFEITERKRLARVVGIDPSKEYVAYAGSRNPFPGRASFQVGDGQALNFPDGAFDSSASLLVFNFIPDPAKALKDVRRVTRSGGRISAAVWDYGAGMRMLRTFWDAAVTVDSSAEKADERHMPLCRSGELSDLWKRGGLEDVHEQPLDITMQFKSFADYWDPFLLGQGPAGSFLARLNQEKVQALRREVKRRLSLASETTPFALPARVWAVRGTVPKGG